MYIFPYVLGSVSRLNILLYCSTFLLACQHFRLQGTSIGLLTSPLWGNSSWLRLSVIVDTDFNSYLIHRECCGHVSGWRKMDGRQRGGHLKPLGVTTACKNKTSLWSEFVIPLFLPSAWKLGFWGQWTQLYTLPFLVSILNNLFVNLGVTYCHLLTL